MGVVAVKGYEYRQYGRVGKFGCCSVQQDEANKVMMMVDISAVEEG